MLMTFDELEVGSDEMRQERVSAWSGVFPLESESLLVLRFLRRKADGGIKARTMLTTAAGLVTTLNTALPATVLAAYAVRFDEDLGLVHRAIDQVWLPNGTEGRDGTLLRLEGEAGLRDGKLQAVRDIEGRALLFEVNGISWLQAGADGLVQAPSSL